MERAINLPTLKRGVAVPSPVEDAEVRVSKRVRRTSSDVANEVADYEDSTGGATMERVWDDCHESEEVTCESTLPEEFEKRCKEKSQSLLDSFLEENVTISQANRESSGLGLMQTGLEQVDVTPFSKNGVELNISFLLEASDCELGIPEIHTPSEITCDHGIDGSENLIDLSSSFVVNCDEPLELEPWNGTIRERMSDSQEAHSVKHPVGNGVDFNSLIANDLTSLSGTSCSSSSVVLHDFECDLSLDVDYMTCHEQGTYKMSSAPVYDFEFFDLI